MSHEFPFDTGRLHRNVLLFILLYLFTLLSVSSTVTFAPDQPLLSCGDHGRSAAPNLHGGCTSTDPSVAVALQKRCRTAARGRKHFGRFGGEVAAPTWHLSGRDDAVLDVDHLRRR